MRYKLYICILVTLICVLPFLSLGQDYLRSDYSLTDFDLSGQTYYMIYQNAFSGWYIKAFDMTDGRVSYVNGTDGTVAYSEALSNYSTWGTVGSGEFGSYYDRFGQ